MVGTDEQVLPVPLVGALRFLLAAGLPSKYTTSPPFSALLNSAHIVACIARERAGLREWTG